MGTDIAARNFTDPNRYDLLPKLAERMGLDMSSERTLWRDKAMILLNEAVLLSYDRAGIKMADHPEASHEFLDFCRAEQSMGREPYGRWVRLVPPISGSATPLYQEPFHDISFKPAHRYQAAAWLAYTAGYATRTSAGAWSPEAPLGSAGKLDDRGSAGA